MHCIFCYNNIVLIQTQKFKQNRVFLYNTKNGIIASKICVYKPFYSCQNKNFEEEVNNLVKIEEEKQLTIKECVI
jgi:hypothetical protein